MIGQISARTSSEPSRVMEFGFNCSAKLNSELHFILTDGLQQPRAEPHWLWDLESYTSASVWVVSQQDWRNQTNWLGGDCWICRTGNCRTRKWRILEFGGLRNEGL